MKRFFLISIPLLAIIIAAAVWRQRRDPAVTQATLARQDPLVESVLSITNGKRAKLVWVENVSKGSDQFALGKALTLESFDTATGKRRILPKRRNYGRPLISPDGNYVVYSDRGTTGQDDQEFPKAAIHRVDWEGTKDEVIADGFAVDMIQDSAGTMWVYALRKLLPGGFMAVKGEDLIRFPLLAPDKVETVYRHETIGVDNLQISRDGKRCVGLFPWPDAYLVNLENGHRKKLRTGCWTSMAPDNSYLSWVFSGSHKRVFFHDSHDGSDWGATINKFPNLEQGQVYHPRWTNHPEFFTMTGPYLSKKSGGAGKEGTDRNPSKSADVYFARFSTDLKRVEHAVQITKNEHGDFYPDAWIEGGETVNLAGFAQATQEVSAAPISAPPDALFAWSRADADNLLPGRSVACKASARNIARYGSHGEMMLDGGMFEIDEISTRALRSHLEKQKQISLDFVLTEYLEPPSSQSATVVAFRHESKAIWELLREPGMLRATGELSVPLEFQRGKPRHLHISLTPTEVVVWIDGLVAGQKALGNLPLDKSSAFQFGAIDGPPGTWSATVEEVQLFSHLAGQQEIKDRMGKLPRNPLPPIPRIKLLARLDHATLPDSSQLGSYRRMLVDHTYDVLKVLEGEYAAKSVVVLHWAILDLHPVEGIPHKVGQTYELVLEPVTAHPELTSELQLSESDDLETEQFLNAMAPKLVPK